MPYTLIRSGGKVKVVNKDTGNVHAKGSTPANAAKQLRLLQAVEHNPSFHSR